MRLTATLISTEDEEEKEERIIKEDHSSQLALHSGHVRFRDIMGGRQYQVPSAIWFPFSESTVSLTRVPVEQRGCDEQFS